MEESRDEAKRNRGVLETFSIKGHVFLVSIN